MNANNLLDETPFGKHRGKLVIEVIENDPDYMKWLISEAGFELDNEAYERYRTVADGRGLEP